MTGRHLPDPLDPPAVFVMDGRRRRVYHWRRDCSTLCRGDAAGAVVQLFGSFRHDALEQLAPCRRCREMDVTGWENRT